MTRSLDLLPKAHLHLHLEGGLRPATLADLAQSHGLPVPPVTGFQNFTEFDLMYQAACDVLRTPDDMARLVHELAEDAAATGCVWIEPAVWLPLHNTRLGPDETVLEILVDAAKAATAATGVGIGYLIASDRNLTPAEAEEQARIAARWAGRGVVAFGLHNDEARYPGTPFAQAFRIAKDAGLLATPHAGELAGPASVIEALDILGADRIQHGIRAAEDPALLERLAEQEICLDVCPTSNLVLEVVPSYAEHPLPALLAAGVPCSINGDDPIMFDCDLRTEYEHCRTSIGLTDAQIAALARASLRGSAAPTDTLKNALAGIDAWLAHD
ncbi:MAG: adenosine deaminase [Actinomycetia bacterium]|nr:adenosine deaminase [Actinomycetes bacterium]